MDMMPFSPDRSEIFRQASLDRLSSPERIDQLEVLIPRRSWLILLGFLLFIALGIFWGFHGSIPTKIGGKGILLAPGGVCNAFAPGSGVLRGIAVKPEQVVNKGDIMARIENPELAKEIEAARQRLAELKEEGKVTASLQQNERSTQADLAQKRRNILLDSIEVLKSQKKLAEERAAEQEQLQEKGLMTRQAVLETRREIQRLEAEIRNTGHQVMQLPAETLELANRQTRETLSREAEIAEAMRRVELLEKRSELTSSILAPETGKVLEVMAAEGDHVGQSQPIFSLEPQGGGRGLIEAVIYVSMKDGKQVKPGMAVQIAPASVKREEYGFLMGNVLSVSPFPATAQGMQAVLGNSQLVQALLAGGAPIVIRAELLQNPSTPSGYRWSGGKGPEIILTSGTLCDTSIVVREQPPLTLLIPAFKDYTGL